jgi:hypothetical protein
MNACGFDRFDFYGCLERVESAIAAQVRLHSGSSDLLSAFRGRPDWADNNFEQRVMRVKKAIDESHRIAIRNLQRKLGGINLQDIWPVLAEICHDMALYLGGGATAGGVAGAAIGAFAFGVGAIPGAFAGAALGMKLGAMLLNFIGLKSVVEYMVESIPLAIDEYQKGFSDAWGPVPSLHGDWRDRRPLSSHFCDSGFAAEHFASGHEIIVVSLLTGIVAYLTRGKGDLKSLVAEASSQARLGQKFATWLQENSRKLTAIPMLQGRDQAGRQAVSKNSSSGAAAHQPTGADTKPTVNGAVSQQAGKADVGAKTTSATQAKGGNNRTRPLRLEEIVAPNGKTIQTAVNGNAVVPIEKVKIYARGKVVDVSEELRALNQYRQKARKMFDANPENAARLKQLKKMQHNFDRSVDLKQRLEDIGLPNSEANNNLLINHLLDTGQGVNSANREWVSSILKGPSGSLQVKSTWKILGDNRAYLSTLVLVPVK